MRIVLALLAAGLLAQASAEPVSWPQGRRAAAVLTYDDSLPSQLDIAVPALDAAGLRGTFFLSGAKIRGGDIPRWRAAAAEGHELGNHTIYHPCLRSAYSAPEQYYADNYSVDTMLNEIRVMNVMLMAIDGKTLRSYAMPCGVTEAGGKDYMVPLRKSGLVRFARGAGPSIVDDPGNVDLMTVPSVWFNDRNTGAHLIDMVQRVERSGGMVVFGFHGVGGDYLTVTAAAHAELVDYLRQHKSTVWTGTFSEVMGYVASHRAK